SIKFYKALKKIGRLVWGKKGPRVSFVYSNLVKVGIELFQQVLLQNGYLEYQEGTMYQITPNTICYFCGRTYKEHQTMVFAEDATYDGQQRVTKHVYSKSDVRIEPRQSDELPEYQELEEVPSDDLDLLPISGGQADAAATAAA